MQRTPLSSTAVLSAGYDEATQELELEFRNGRIYRYYAVPAGVYAFLLRTRSKGSFVSRMIDGHYRYEDVTPAPQELDLSQALRASLQASEETRE